MNWRSSRTIFRSNRRIAPDLDRITGRRRDDRPLKGVLVRGDPACFPGKGRVKMMQTQRIRESIDLAGWISEQSKPTANAACGLLPGSQPAVGTA